jgi:hypothetical protein
LISVDQASELPIVFLKSFELLQLLALGSWLLALGSWLLALALGFQPLAQLASFR